MASRNQEHRRYLAANCQRHPPARTHIRPETATDRGTPCHALDRYARSDGIEDIRAGSGNDRAERKGDRTGAQRRSFRDPFVRIL